MASGYLVRVAGIRFVEREIKLDAALDFTMPDLSGIAPRTSSAEPRQLRTAYFDTPDMRLWERGMTLRHREGEPAPGGDGSGTWTIKVPVTADGPALERTELSWPGGRDRIPDEVTSLVRGVVRRAPLTQLTELVTTRRSTVLSKADGSVLAEIDDDDVTVTGGPRDGYQFRQIELELTVRGNGIRKRVIRRLERAGGHVDNDAKVAKALGLSRDTRAMSGWITSPNARMVTPSRRSKSSERRTKRSLGQLVQEQLEHAVDRILLYDYRFRLDLPRFDPEDVHQARVVTRRLRADLKTFRPVLDPVWYRHTQADLKWFGAILGAARDLDVLAARLDASTDQVPRRDPGRDELMARRSMQMAASERGLVDALVGSDRYLDLLDRLHAAARLPPLHPTPERRFRPDARAADALVDLVGRQSQKVRTRVRQSGADPTDAQMHRIRIGAKQVRYAAEMASAVDGTWATRAMHTAKAAKKLQVVLGEHHDAVVIEQWLGDQVADLTPVASFTAGRLAAEQRSRQRVLRRQWRRHWQRLARASAQLDTKKPRHRKAI